jgi:hypothetical protein
MEIIPNDLYKHLQSLEYEGELNDAEVFLERQLTSESAIVVSGCRIFHASKPLPPHHLQPHTEAAMMSKGCGAAG